MNTRRIIAGFLAAAVAAAAAETALSEDSAGEVVEQALRVIRQTNAGLRRFVLDNGMVCLAREDRSAPVVAIQVWINSGSVHEQDYLGSGISHAIEHMIFKGTENRGTADISREISDAGGRINAYTSFDRTVFHTDLPSKGWRTGLDVLADAVMHPTFPAEEWDKEKEVILREFAMGKDNPHRVIGKLVWRTAYKVHPYRFPVIGHEDIFNSIERDDLSGHFEHNYVPEQMILVIIGDVDVDEIEAAVRDSFASFTRRARTPIHLPVEPPQLAPRFARVEGEYSVSRLRWAYHTVPLSHPDAPALDVLANIVGQGRSSRLSIGIKERQQLAHEINAWSFTPRQPGLFGIGASFDPENESDIIEAVQAEIDSWRESGFTPEEIAKALRSVLSAELSELRTMRGQAGNYASGEFYAGDPRFSETYLANLLAVTPERVKAVADLYLQPRNRTLVLLSPERAREPGPDREPATAEVGVMKFTLSNGVRLLVREDHRLPFVYACAAFGGGVLSENGSNAGITRLMSELMVRGTESRPGEEIARTVDSLGAELFSFSGYNSFGLRGRCLSSDTERFMEVLSDCLLNSGFPDEEFKKQKGLHLADIDREWERPFFLAQEQLRHLMFPDHPYRWSPVGTRDTVSGLRRKQVLEHFKELAVAGNLVIAVFGDIDPRTARALCKTGLEGMEEGKAPTTPSPAAPVLPARARRREPREQTVILAGFPGVDILDPRADPLAILEDSLSGLASDLAYAVREERGLAYYVGAYRQAGIQPGMFVLYAGTREDAVDEVQSLLVKETLRVATGGLRGEEIDRARNRLIAAHEMSLQDNSNIAMTCALNELYGLGYNHAFTTRERLEAVTSNAVVEAAASIFSTNKMAVSVVLPHEEPAETETE